MICYAWTANIAVFAAQRHYSASFQASNRTRWSPKYDRPKTNECCSYGLGHKRPQHPTHRVEKSQRCRTWCSVLGPAAAPREKEPEVKAGLDLKLANSLLVEISKFHLVLCHSKQDGKGRVLLGSKSPYP